MHTFMFVSYIQLIRMGKNAFIAVGKTGQTRFHMAVPVKGTQQFYKLTPIDECNHITFFLSCDSVLARNGYE